MNTQIYIWREWANRNLTVSVLPNIKMQSKINMGLGGELIQGPISNPSNPYTLLFSVQKLEFTMTRSEKKKICSRGKNLRKQNEKSLPTIMFYFISQSLFLKVKTLPLFVFHNKIF